MSKKTEEEEAKTILCSLEAIWHTADSARHAAHSIKENLNLLRVVVRNPDIKLVDYLEAVEELAAGLESTCDEIMGEVTRFKEP